MIREFLTTKKIYVWCALYIMLGICVLVNMISKADIINYSLDYTKNGLITYLIVFLATSVFIIFLRTVVDYLTKALCRECEYNGKRKIFDVTCYKELNDIEKKDTQNIIKDSLYMLEEISSYIAGVGETVYNCTMGAGIIIYLMFSGVIIIIPITIMIFDMMLSQKKGNAFMSDFWFKYRQNTNRYNYLSDIMIQKNYIEERKVYRTTDKLNKEFLHEFDKAKQLNCKNGKRRLQLDCSMEAKSRIYMIVMALIFTYYVCSGQMMIGKFVICLECIGILQTIVEKESSKYADKKKYYAMIENYKKYVSIMKNDIKCGCSLETIKNSNIKDDITIVFDKVSYSYPFGEQVIKDFTYTFKKGKFYLIKGHNGAGKSTLIKLALGLYNPDSGTVKINGIDANRLDNELRSRIFSVILQDGNKYPFKVRDNIFFAPDSSYEDISIYLKDKKKLSVYNKLIEKSGVALLNAEEDSTDFSGGEWQQILYLRAALKDYEILIADEPTSKLDIAMRKIIIEKINALKDKKMIIMVSHNSEDEKFADDVIELGDTEIKEAVCYEERI